MVSTRARWAAAVLGASGLAAAFGGCKDDEPAPAPAPSADAAVTFTYRGEGCLYDVSPPPEHAFLDLAGDDPTSPGDAPLRVRLGLGGTTTMGAQGYADATTTVAITWETAAESRAAKVRFGDDAGALAEIRAGYSWTTPPPEVGVGAFTPSTFMHEVHVCGLTPGKTYYYQVGGGTPEVWSATQSFTTLPAEGAVHVGILGDARDDKDVWQLAQRRMRDLAVDIQLTTGDLINLGPVQSYYDDWLGAIWKDPADPTRFITLGQQVMLNLAGNHEAMAARYYAAFALPGQGPYAESYFSLNVGNTHFVLLDDQPVAAFEGSDQGKEILAWLDADLGKAEQNRAQVPFIVAINHRGLYTTSVHADDRDVLAARRLLAPIYDRHKVDVVVNGHDHAFERSKPLKPAADGAGSPVIRAPGEGTVYVVNAGAGAKAYRVDSAAAPYSEKSVKFGDGTPYVGVYGVMTLEQRKLTFTSYGLTVSGADAVIDTLELAK